MDDIPCAKIKLKINNNIHIGLQGPVSNKDTYSITPVGKGYLLKGPTKHAKWLLNAIGGRWNPFKGGWTFPGTRYGDLKKMFPNAKSEETN